MSLFGTPDPIQTTLLQEIQKLSQQLAELEGRHEQLGLADQVAQLQKQIANLEIQRDKKQEDFDRREREVTHKVGLEKKRSETETELAKREAIIEVREEHLTKSQERFEEEMSFQRERFESEVGYLKEMLQQILDRLPTVTVDRKVKG